MPVSSPTTVNSDQWRQFVRDGAAAMGIAVTASQAEQLSLHATELSRWNHKFNLTSITDPIDVAVKHFIDSLLPAQWLCHEDILLDVGTGGGFPGLPLKIIKPALTVTLVDAVGKKVNFVRQVIRIIGLEGIDAIHEGLENLSERLTWNGCRYTVICRAFTALDDFVRLAWPLVCQGGRLIAMKSGNVEPEIASLKKMWLPDRDGAGKVYNLFTVDIQSYELFHLKARRTLIVLTRHKK